MADPDGSKLTPLPRHKGMAQRDRLVIINKQTDLVFDPNRKGGKDSGQVIKKAKIRKKENKTHHLQKVVIRPYLSPDKVGLVNSVLRIF